MISLAEIIQIFSYFPQFSLGAGIGMPDMGFIGNFIYSIFVFAYVALLYAGIPLLIIFVLAKVIREISPEKNSVTHIEPEHTPNNLLLKASKKLSNNGVNKRLFMQLFKYIILGGVFSLIIPIGQLIEINNCSHSNIVGGDGYSLPSAVAFLTYALVTPTFILYSWKRKTQIPIILILVVSTFFMLTFYFYTYFYYTENSHYYYDLNCRGLFRYTIISGPIVVLSLCYIALKFSKIKACITIRSS